jgi:predicted P-loop ATPase
MTSFCGTTNDIEFLTDLTGTRRFLVIPCISIDYMEAINLDKLWGYVYHLLKSGEHYWITQKEIDEVVEFNRALLLKPVEILAVEEFYNLHPQEGEGFWITANELEHTIGVSKWILGRKLKQYQVRYRTSRGIVQYYVQKTEI